LLKSESKKKLTDRNVAVPGAETIEVMEIRCLSPIAYNTMKNQIRCKERID
jgi:hypothetical protein